MSIKTINNASLYGMPTGTLSLAPLSIIAKRAPQDGDLGQLGQQWIYNNQVWMLTSSGNWTLLATPSSGEDTYDELIVDGFLKMNGSVTVAGTVTPIYMNTQTAPINIGTDGVAKTITIGNTTTRSTLAIYAGVEEDSGEISFSAPTGNIRFKAATSTTTTIVGNAITLTANVFMGSWGITGTGFGTAAVLTITMNNTVVDPVTRVIASFSVDNVSGNAASVSIVNTNVIDNAIVWTVQVGAAQPIDATDILLLNFIILDTPQNS